VLLELLYYAGGGYFKGDNVSENLSCIFNESKNKADLIQ
jgi:hypothetical protein